MTYRDKLIKQCDWLHRQILLRKRGIQCEKCGTKNFHVEHDEEPPWVEFRGIIWIKVQGLDRAHVYCKKTYKHMRWNDVNCVLLGAFCCHRGSGGAHDAISDFKEWYKRRIGEEKFDNLTYRAKALNIKVNISFLEILKKKLKEELNGM